MDGHDQRPNVLSRITQLVSKWQDWDVNPNRLAPNPNSTQRGGGRGFQKSTQILSPTTLYHLVLLNTFKGAYPTSSFLSWMVQESGVWLPLKRIKKCEICLLSNGFSTETIFRAPKRHVGASAKSFWKFKKSTKPPPGAPLSMSPCRRENSHEWRLPSREALRTANFQDLWKKDIASLKRLMSFTRQMPWMLGRGQQRSRGGGGRDTYRELLHSSMSGVVRRCPPHGNNCSRRTSSPGGHWSLADGWAVTCPSHPALGSQSEECTCQHRDP